MRHRKYKVQLGRRSDHVRSMLSNQVGSLIREGRIKTTVSKAKATRRLAERMVTLARKGDLASRRRAISSLKDLPTVRHLFDVYGPLFSSRPGGYTRIVRIGPRRGDSAEMCYLEWVESPLAAVAAPIVAEEAAEATED